jgi:hypothetical protein
VGGTLSVPVTIVSVTPLPTVTVKLSDGSFEFINQLKSAPYILAATPTLTGTVVGFTNAGTVAIVKEADGNLLSIPTVLGTAT